MSAANPAKPKPRATLAQHVIVFVFAIALPAFATVIAQVSWVSYERKDGNVHATAKTCVFFAIPYRTQVVGPVTEFSDRFHEGEINEYRRSGQRKRRVKEEDEAFLRILGDGQEAEVSVTPVDVKQVLEKSQAFLADPAAKELRLFVVGNWKATLFAGGLSLLTVLTVVGYSLALISGVLRLLASPFRRPLKENAEVRTFEET